MKKRIAFVAALVLAFSGIVGTIIYLVKSSIPDPNAEQKTTSVQNVTANKTKIGYGTDAFYYEDLPEYSGDALIDIGDGKTDFSEGFVKRYSDKKTSNKDELDRAEWAYTVITIDDIDEDANLFVVKQQPSGWYVNEECINPRTNKTLMFYYATNLISPRLGGKKSDPRNQITATHLLKAKGFMAVQNMIIEYLKENPEDKVMFRVTPVFIGEEKLCRGVVFEAASVNNPEEFNISKYAYNVEKGYEINYTNGEYTEIVSKQSKTSHTHEEA